MIAARNGRSLGTASYQVQLRTYLPDMPKEYFSAQSEVAAVRVTSASNSAQECHTPKRNRTSSGANVSWPSKKRVVPHLPKKVIWQVISGPKIVPAVDV